MPLRYLDTLYLLHRMLIILLHTANAGHGVEQDLGSLVNLYGPLVF